MLFSIVVPIYKVEKHIRQCIESILKQSYGKFELILVDDGSPDNCPKICDEYANSDDRIIVIHKENGGLVSARKAGANIAKGDYVVAVDGDDYISEKTLKSLFQILEKNPVDVIAFGSINFYSDGKEVEEKLKERKGLYLRDQIEEEILPHLITAIDGKRFTPSICGKAFKRTAYTKFQNEVPDNIKIGEDSCVTYPFVYKANSLYIMEETFYYYRQNEESMTKAKKAFSWEEVLLRANLYEQKITEDKFKDQIARITTHSMFNVAVTEFYEKSYRNAKKAIKEKIKNPAYRKYLDVVKFEKNFKEKLASYCLKKGKYFPIYLYSKIK